MASESDPRTRRAVVIAFGLQKGGANKTSVATNVADGLARLGARVLVIDVDSNYGATNALLGGEDAQRPGAFELMLGRGKPEAVIVKSDEAVLPTGVDFVPADRRLEKLARELEKRRIPEHRALDKAVAALRSSYDYILLDTGPSASPGTKAAYCVADWFVIVAQAQPLCEVPIMNTLSDLREAQHGPNPGLKLAGIVLSNVNERTVVQREFLRPIRERFKSEDEAEPKFAVISAGTCVPRSQGARQTVLQFAPRSKVAAQYRDLARRLHRQIQRGSMKTKSVRGEEHEERHVQAV